MFGRLTYIYKGFAPFGRRTLKTRTWVSRLYPEPSLYLLFPPLMNPKDSRQQRNSEMVEKYVPFWVMKSLSDTEIR